MKGALIPGGRRPIAAAVSLLVLAIAITANMLIDASSPQPTDAAKTQFSAERAREMLEDIATKPRPLGSAESDRVRDMLADDLAKLGFDVEVNTAVGGEADDNEVVFGRADNVVATLAGSDPTGRVLLASHYDSVAAGSGASDAATPTAAIMETARALAQRPKPRNDIVILLTDGEESGLLGADAYARAHPSQGDDVVLNWEARGVDGPSLMFETSTGNSRLIDVYAESAPYTTGDSSMVEIYRNMPNDTDFTNFLDAGYSGLNSANIGSPQWYHTPGDSLDHADESTLAHHGANMFGLAAAFGDEDLSTMKSDSDTIYFHLFALFVSYTPGWGIALAVLSVGLLAAAVVVARRQRQLSLPRMAAAGASIIAPLLLSVAAAQVMWEVMTLSRSGLVDTGGMLHSPTPFVVTVGLLTAAVVLTWYLTLRRILGPIALALGGLAWLSLLGAALAVWAPGAAFRLSIPALLGAAACLAAMILAPRAPKWVSVAVLVVGLTPGAAILAGTGSSLAEAFGLSLAGASALLFAMAGVLLAPVIELCLSEPDAQRARFGWAAPVVAAGMAVVVCASGLWGAGFDKREPRPTYLAYVMDADSKQATWVTNDADTSEWTSKYVSSAGEPKRVPHGYREQDAIGHWGKAPAVDLPAPVATVERDGDQLHVHVESRRDAKNLTVRTRGDVVKATAEIPGTEAATKDLTVADSGPWGSSITFLDPSKEGVDFTLTFAGDVDEKLTLFDRSDGLDQIDGFSARPAEEMRSPIRNSDSVTILTTVG